MAKPPRPDVLWYPRYSWASVLVRRTHDVTLARALAELCWAEHDDDRPLVASRVGWWRTYPASAVTMPAAAAEDRLGRIVEWCAAADRGAGPGVEFRP
jgi:hypothetical protein